jgi:hypothetical protein
MKTFLLCAVVLSGLHFAACNDIEGCLEGEVADAGRCVLQAPDGAVDVTGAITDDAGSRDRGTTWTISDAGAGPSYDGGSGTTDAGADLDAEVEDASSSDDAAVEGAPVRPHRLDVYGTPCFVESKGTVVCWGGTPRTASTVQGVTDAIEVAVTGSLNCARKTDGTVACWSSANQATPVAGLTNVTEIRGGDHYFEGQNGAPGYEGSTVCAVANSSAVCLRRNPSGGQIDLMPVANLTGVKHIGVGLMHKCAVITDGTVKCWGENRHGQLGITAGFGTVDIQQPTTVPGLMGVRDVSAGYGFTCVVFENGTVSCWGKNDAGQIGAPEPANTSTPSRVNGLTMVAALESGYHNTCALMEDSTVRCWGNGGPTAPSPGLLAAEISVAVNNACMLRIDGAITCWDRSGGSGTTLSF